MNGSHPQRGTQHVNIVIAVHILLDPRVALMKPLQPRHQRALLRDSKRATEQRLAVDAPLPPELAAVWTALELPDELAAPGPWTEATADHNERRRPLPERTPPA